MKVTDSGLRCLRFSCFALGLLTAWLTTGLCIAVDADHAQRMREGLALFDSTIAPLLKENCVNCHGGQNVKGDLDFATRAGLLKGGSHGQTIIPGDGAGSFMYQVTARLEEPFMPSKGDRLGPKQVEALNRWIDLGAPYSKPLVDDPREVVDLSVVTDEDRQFWSFRPLQTDFGGRNSVDQFITRKLEEQGLSLSPVADRRTLITRVSLDLTGLPPTLRRSMRFSPTHLQMPGRRSSAAFSTVRTMANAGRGTGWTWPGMPTAADLRMITTGIMPGPTGIS